MGLKLEVGKLYKNAHGEKIGPIADQQWSDGFPYHGGRGMGFYNAHGIAQSSLRPDLIAEWTDAPTGPVRTVTRTTREIVPGEYDGLEVGHAVNGMVFLAMPIANHCQESIDALIANLNAIRDALEDQ